MKLNTYDMMIVGKYFESESDYLNMSMINSKFKDVNKMYHYNPIPINSKKIFENIETQYLYSTKDNKLDVENYIHYEQARFEIGRTNDVYKNILFKKYDLLKYFKNQEVVDLRNYAITKIINNCAYNILLFEHIKIKKIILPPSIKGKIPNDFFREIYSLEEVDFSNARITEFGERCFGNCYNLRKVEVPDSVKVFGDYCFGNCKKLESIRIPSGLEQLKIWSFYNCVSLKGVFKLPSTIKYIGTKVFENCENLEVDYTGVTFE